MMLARFAVVLAVREAARSKGHSNNAEYCHCVNCQWRNGIEAEADAAFGKEWRP